MIVIEKASGQIFECTLLFSKFHLTTIRYFEDGTTFRETKLATDDEAGTYFEFLSYL